MIYIEYVIKVFERSNINAVSGAHHGAMFKLEKSGRWEIICVAISHTDLYIYLKR